MIPSGPEHTDWVKLAAGQKRPMMLITAARMERLRQRISQSAEVATRWERLKARGVELLDIQWTPEKTAAEGTWQHANYGPPAHELGEIVQTLGMLHMLEPDPRYVAKIRDGLLHYAGYDVWCAPSFFKRVPPWRSELITSAFCFAYALGYDLVRDSLAPGDRECIGAALAEKGVKPILEDWLLPGRRIHALDSMGHNWWIVCLSMAGLGAISLLGDNPAAPGWIDAIERSVPLWFGYGGNVLQSKIANFDSGGAFYEGVGYANYAMMEYLRYRTALVDACPGCVPAGHPALERVEKFFLHTLYPASDGYLTVNFCDQMISKAATSSMRLLLANGVASPLANWYVKRTATGQAVPMDLLLDADEVTETPVDSLPTSVLFPGVGWAVMRSSWEDNATMLAARSGPFWGHAHADSGSFILFHHGRPLIVDAGFCVYSNPEYTKYYVTSRAHNVVLVDGKGVPPEIFTRGTKFHGTMHSLLDDAGVKYVYADATGPMAHLLARHFRHWLWVDGSIVIFDDLLAHEPACFNWLLHHAGTAEMDGQDAVVRNSSAEARVRVLHPEQLQAARPVAPAPDRPDEQAGYLEFSTTQKQQQQNFVTVITPLEGKEGQLPGIEKFEATDLLGIRIRGETTDTDIYFNLLADGRRMHENSCASIEGWETDAYLFAVSRPKAASPDDIGNIRRLIVVGGSYLRRGKTVVLDSLSKVDALIVPDTQRPRISIHGQPAIELNIHQISRPREVIVNGSAIPFEFTEREQNIRCRVSL